MMKNNKPYALYYIKNFNVRIDDDDENNLHTFNLNADPIERISFTQKEVETKSNLSTFPEICQAIITYKDDTMITGDVLAYTKHFLERYLMLFVIEKRIEISSISVKLECYSNRSEEKTGAINVYDSFHIHDKIAKIFRSYGSESFNKTFKDALLDDTDESISNDFEVLKSVFDITNIESRYLLQYEFLKHLVAELYGKAHGSQVLVQQFVVDKYNAAASALSKVCIRKSLLDPNKDQDELTYYRNVIGHPAVTETEKEIFKDIDLYQTLIAHSRLINEVILFAIREKKRLNGGIY